MSDNFRLNARKVFITYPQCDMPKLDALMALNTDKVKYILVAQEKHKVEGLHLHVVIQFKKKVDIKRADYFDLIHNFKIYHPNIQTCRSIDASIKYAKKDGDYIEKGCLDEIEKKVTCPDYDASLSKLEWMTICCEQKIPFGYALLIWEENQPSKTINTIESFDLTNKSRISCPKLQLLAPTTDHLKSYLIVGPSGCGKTTWAKLHCQKPALLVTHMDDLKCFRIDFHKAIIFDDMSFMHLDPILQIPIVDRYDLRSVHCRYSCAVIPAGVQKIFTCNTVPVKLELPQIQRRCNLINLY